MKIYKNIIFVILLIIFIYFRLVPIFHQVVPYTYDQGRDFLKAAEMINEGKPTFIGPTTGITGLFHGAWWYYLLIIPYLIFNGWSTGFYIFMFLISTFFNLLFFNFIKNRFGLLTGLFFLAIVSISSYFIPLSFFVSNNIIVPYLIICLIVLTFHLFDNKNSNKYLFLLLGLNLSFILEFEVAFGLFIIPAYLLSMLFFEQMRNKLFQSKNLFFLLIGLVIPVVPRLLFEIKNHFLQSKTVIGFFISPKLHNPKPFSIVLTDRLILFWNYYESIFYNKNTYLAIIVIISTLVVLFVYRKKLVKIKSFLFLALITVLLFFLSLFYKDNFWGNYYEGIQYLFLIFIVIGFYLLSKHKKVLAIFVFVILFALNIFAFYKNISQSKTEVIGLKETTNSVDFVKNKVGKNDYCLRIYTPPVIPYTYNYIIQYYNRQGLMSLTRPDFVDNRCIYIIEKDPYEFRFKKWQEENKPKTGTLIENKIISNNVNIEIWESK